MGIFRKDEKYLKPALALLIIGWLFFWIISYLHKEESINIFNATPIFSMPKTTSIYFNPIFKVVGILLGLTSMLLIVRTKVKRTWHKILLLLSSFFLLFLIVLVFPNTFFEIEFLFYEDMPFIEVD